MSKDSKKVEVTNESLNKPVDMNVIEMIFGTPASPKTGQIDMHTIANEKKHSREPYSNHNEHNNHRDVETLPTQPLLEPDREKQKPPLAGPEVDDLDDIDDARPAHAAPYPGIDDGLLEPEDKKKPEGSEDDDDDQHKTKDGSDHLVPGGGRGGDDDDGNWWPGGVDEPDMPYGDLLALWCRYYTLPQRKVVQISDYGHSVVIGPRFGEDGPISPVPSGLIPDVNTYQQKKNLAQGMMDLALLSANANQLRYVLESSTSHPYYYFSVVFISLSIILQVAVGIGLIMNSRYDVKEDKEICKADKINNMTVLGVFLITVVNVFIASFSVASQNTVPVSPRTDVQTIG